MLLLLASPTCRQHAYALWDPQDSASSRVVFWTPAVSQASSLDNLKLEVIDRQDLVVNAFKSRSSDSGPRRVARFCAKSIWKNTTVPITAFESTHALCPHPTVPHDITIMVQTRKIQLANPRKGEETSQLRS